MSKEEPLIVSDEQLIRLLKDANKKLGDHARLLTEQLSDSQKRETMLREALESLSALGIIEIFNGNPHWIFPMTVRRRSEEALAATEELK